MNKHYRVIAINGVRGICTVIFIIFGLIAGFIVSPAWVCMKIWNYFADKYAFMEMDIYQGLLLWGIIAICTHQLMRSKTSEDSESDFSVYSNISRKQLFHVIRKQKRGTGNMIDELEKLKESCGGGRKSSDKEAVNADSENNPKEEI